MRLDSRLQKSRHGIYYLRIQQDGLDCRWSLPARNLRIAAIAVYEFSAKLFIVKNDSTRQRQAWVFETSGNDIKMTTEDKQVFTKDL